jgi:hypothetical protein
MMRQSLMDNYDDYDGLAVHEASLAREFHVMIAKQKISLIQSKLDVLSKDEPIHALSQQFLKSEYYFKLYHIVFLSGLFFFAIYFFATFINF